MVMKTYGLKTLARICTAKTGPLDDATALKAIQAALRCRFIWPDERGRYIVKCDGLWLASRDEVIGTPPEDEAVLHWAPNQKDELPALPIPFTAAEFAAFTLAGMGSFVGEQFYGDDGTLDEEALTALCVWGDEPLQLLREAERLKLEAYRQQRIEDGRGEHKQPRDVSAAADWLLNTGREAAAGRVGTPTLEQAPQAAVVPQAAPAKGEAERRLTALRAIGGDVKWWRGAWKITGINNLTEQEKGRPRSSQKTIRLDLIEAAEAEKREGTKPAWCP
jgi:hypothetical protein